MYRRISVCLLSCLFLPLAGCPVQPATTQPSIPLSPMQQLSVIVDDTMELEAAVSDDLTTARKANLITEAQWTSIKATLDSVDTKLAQAQSLINTGTATYDAVMAIVNDVKATMATVKSSISAAPAPAPAKVGS